MVVWVQDGYAKKQEARFQHSLQTPPPQSDCKQLFQEERHPLWWVTVEARSLRPSCGEAVLSSSWQNQSHGHPSAQSEGVCSHSRPMGVPQGRRTRDSKLHSRLKQTTVHGHGFLVAGVGQQCPPLQADKQLRWRRTPAPGPEGTHPPRRRTAPPTFCVFLETG